MTININNKNSMCDKSKIATIRSANESIQVHVANTFVSRLRGLLWRKPLAKKEGLLLMPCNSIHTLGMQYSIDIIFLSQSLQIVAIKNSMPTNRFAFSRKAKHTLELLAGQAKALNLKPGMQLMIDKK